MEHKAFNYNRVTLEEALDFYRFHNEGYHDWLANRKVWSGQRLICWLTRINYAQAAILISMLMALALYFVGLPIMQIKAGLLTPLFIGLGLTEVVLIMIVEIVSILKLKAEQEESELRDIGVWLHFLESEPKDETFRSTLEWIVNYHPFFQFSYMEYLSELELVHMGMDRGR